MFTGASMALPARNRRSAAGTAGSLTSMLELVYGPELRPSGDCSKPAPSRIRTLLAVFDSFIGTHDSVCGRSPTPVQASRRPLGPQRHSSRLQLHVPRLRQAPRCRTSPVREVRRTFWLTASPRSPRACLAPGARQQLKASLDAGVRGLGISPARARTNDESARAGPTTSRRMNPAIVQALRCSQPLLGDDVRIGPAVSITSLPPHPSSGPYARRPHAPSWKPPNISGRLIAANLRKQSISLPFVFRTRLARLNATIRAGFDASAFAVPHAPGAVIKPIYGGRASTSSMRCPAMLSWRGIKAKTRCTSFRLPRDSPFDDPDTIRAERRQASAQAAHNSRLRVMNETA